MLLHHSPDHREPQATSRIFRREKRLKKLSH
jgi:hypothetical protein